ncbi:MAG: mannose/fructose/sorbose PTS transporter subunit IIB [Acidipropionibacterium sp.]|jgi:PTS system sorbose-specific IIB component|nr:mannose/fructose/sorbose PTS transporter subunit IIB [Acidipropionibacterium sp.]
MIITLARIDDRLIHGQVTTVWAKGSNADRIIIISDEVFEDKIRTTLLKQAAPPGIKVNIVSVSKAVAVFNNLKYASDKVFLLFTTPTDAVRLVESGVTIKTLNIGGMQFRDGKTQLNKAVFITPDEAKAFYRLRDLGVELDLRVLKSDPHSDIIAKIEEKFGKDLV